MIATARVVRRSQTLYYILVLKERASAFGLKLGKFFVRLNCRNVVTKRAVALISNMISGLSTRNRDGWILRSDSSLASMLSCQP